MKNIFAVLFCFSSMQLSAAESVRWVQDSWIPVYQKADTTSSVVAHWVVNAQVWLIDTSKEWCRAKTSLNQEGFVKCDLLGTEKIAQAKDPMMYFWLNPSLSTWEAAGKFLEKNISDEDRNEEYNTGQSKRYPVPEFDAMKERMKQGFISESIISTANESDKDTPINYDNEVVERLKNLQKKIEIKTSFFKRRQDVFFLTNDTLPEAIQKIRFSKSNAKLIKINAIEAYGDNNHVEMGGFWDVGALEIELGQFLYFHKIGADGLVEASKENYIKTTMPRITCGGTPIYEAQFARELKDYPHVSNSIANFYLRQPMLLKAVNVQTSLRKQQIKYSPDAPSINGKLVETVNYLLYEIDLDKDGVTDILVESFYERGGMGGLDLHWRRYINVLGYWHFVDENFEEDCT